MLTARDLAQFGYEHPMGPDWRGIMDIDPVKLSREKIIKFCDEIDTQAIRDIFPVGTPKEVAQSFKGFVDAGLRVPKIMDYGGMAGRSSPRARPQKVREAEDELLRLCGDAA